MTTKTKKLFDRWMAAQEAIRLWFQGIGQLPDYLKENLEQAETEYKQAIDEKQWNNATWLDDFCRVGRHGECMAPDCSCECHARKAER